MFTTQKLQGKHTIRGGGLQIAGGMGHLCARLLMSFLGQMMLTHKRISFSFIKTTLHCTTATTFTNSNLTFTIPNQVTWMNIADCMTTKKPYIFCIGTNTVYLEKLGLLDFRETIAATVGSITYSHLICWQEQGARG